MNFLDNERNEYPILAVSTRGAKKLDSSSSVHLRRFSAALLCAPMPTLKFRIWNNAEKKMLTPEYFAIRLDGVLLVKAAREDVWPQRSGNYEVVMQSTGLLDKNGKEIFEGDVLKKNWLKEHGKYVVVWGIHGWCFKDQDGRVWEGNPGLFVQDEWDAKNPSLDNFHVIGNIYENPDLLPKAA